MPPPSSPPPQPPPRQRGPTADRLPNCCHRCGLTFPSRNKLMRHFFPTSPSTATCQGTPPSTSQPPPPSDPQLVPETTPLTTAQLQQMKAELQGLLARVDELLAKRAAAEPPTAPAIAAPLMGDIKVTAAAAPEHGRNTDVSSPVVDQTKSEGADDVTAALTTSAPRNYQREDEETATPPSTAAATAKQPRRRVGGGGGSISSSSSDTDDDDDGCRITTFASSST
ncbi:hypothetical protein QBC39DRAFT_356001 [Podospora conica]|nr:hypothetical protein QBC39DRAFT_356001 [Schizothecium conicum]